MIILDLSNVEQIIQYWKKEQAFLSADISGMKKFLDNNDVQQTKNCEYEVNAYIQSIEHWYHNILQYRKYLANSLTDKTTLSEANLSEEQLATLQRIVNEAREYYKTLRSIKKDLIRAKTKHVKARYGVRLVSRSELLSKLESATKR